jgi:hypothetical protein
VLGPALQQGRFDGWNDWVLQWKGSPNADGYLQMWRNGKLVLPMVTGIRTACESLPTPACLPACAALCSRSAHSDLPTPTLLHRRQRHGASLLEVWRLPRQLEGNWAAAARHHHHPPSPMELSRLATRSPVPRR